MWDSMMAAFFDELEKISTTLSTSEEQLITPAKPAEVKAPITPKQIKAKAVNPSTKKGVSTNYTRSNVEAPGTDVSITAHQKAAPPPPPLT